MQRSSMKFRKPYSYFGSPFSIWCSVPGGIIQAREAAAQQTKLSHTEARQVHPVDRPVFLFPDHPQEEGHGRFSAGHL